MLIANRTKKGYYIRRVKEGLWSTFGFNRIKPFGDNYMKDQMREWKQSEEAKTVHDDLYKISNPDNESSDLYLILIIKSVFAGKELMQENVIWTQSVLESIFDIDHLSTKIDTEVIDTWKETIKRNEQVRSHVNCIVFFFVIFNY